MYVHNLLLPTSHSYPRVTTVRVFYKKTRQKKAIARYQKAGVFVSNCAPALLSVEWQSSKITVFNKYLSRSIFMKVRPVSINRWVPVILHR